MPVELAALRLGLRGEPRSLALPRLSGGPPAPPRWRVEVHGADIQVPVWEREELACGQVIEGPAIIVEPVATTWIAPCWTCRVRSGGSLDLERRG
ncbi:MAG: hypothetical protein D6786_03115 [Gammaproteobacteria bacterium]|nr:MAG: hypothetical protein D6786_03115 [Gammaproteobacteria bacterium]